MTQRRGISVLSVGGPYVLLNVKDQDNMILNAWLCAKLASTWEEVTLFNDNVCLQIKFMTIFMKY